MAKTIRFTYDGIDYTLEFTRRTVQMTEDDGFNLNLVDSKPATMIPLLFSGAFKAHHRFTKPDTIAQIFEAFPDKLTLIEKLGEMYSDAFETLMKDPEDAKSGVDDKLVMPSDSTKGGEGFGSGPLTIGEFFEQMCPIYMFFGITPQEYWDGDVDLAKWYRRKSEYEQKHENYIAWLNGMYVYQAILDCVPVLRAFSKATRPEPYLTEPFPITSKEREEKEEEEKRKCLKETKLHFEAYALRFNARFDEKQKAEKGDVANVRIT